MALLLTVHEDGVEVSEDFPAGLEADGGAMEALEAALEWKASHPDSVVTILVWNDGEDS